MQRCRQVGALALLFSAAFTSLRRDLELTSCVDIPGRASDQRLKDSRLHHECLLTYIVERQLLRRQRKCYCLLLARLETDPLEASQLLVRTFNARLHIV